MNNQNEIGSVIARIQRMEIYYNALRNAMLYAPDTIEEDDLIRGMLRRLTEYYDSRQWLDDYHADEQGRLPEGLRRGVLSEDGVYNLLSDIEEYYSEKDSDDVYEDSADKSI